MRSLCIQIFIDKLGNINNIAYCTVSTLTSTLCNVKTEFCIVIFLCNYIYIRSSRTYSITITTLMSRLTTAKFTNFIVHYLVKSKLSNSLPRSPLFLSELLPGETTF